MESTAQIAKHPIHPMLIPFPFALLSTAAAFDIAAVLTRRHAHARTGDALMRVGIGSALVAALPGIIDYFGTVPPHSSTRRDATKHALGNLSALACFAAAQSARPSDGRLPGARQLAFEIAGSSLLMIGGWLGGRLVYHHHVGLADAPVEAAPPLDDETATAPVRRWDTTIPGRVPETV
jgi:uncharacterized membrane protein